MQQGTDALLKANLCLENRAFGIKFGKGAAGRAISNTCKENGWSGIAATDVDTEPVLNDNKCNNNAHHGILFADGAGGAAKANTCTKNGKDGIGVCDSVSSPILTGNQCRNNGRWGISFWNGANPEIGSGNIVSGNRGNERSATQPTHVLEAARTLIKQLGAERWQEREEAAQKLIKMGPPIQPILLAHLGHPDPEVRQRLQRILRAMVGE
jgi:parallel beta-helix repeat protein